MIKKTCRDKNYFNEKPTISSTNVDIARYKKYSSQEDNNSDRIQGTVPLICLGCKQEENRNLK